MAKIQGTFLGPKTPDYITREDEIFQEISQVLAELIRRTTALAETMAAIALVLRESGLIEVDEDDGEPDDGDAVQLVIGDVEPGYESEGLGGV